MPKKTDQSEFEAILQSIVLFPQGASLEQINETLKIPLHRRALQRRLVILIKEGRVLTKGEARSRQYKLPPSTTQAPSILPRTAIETKSDKKIPLSPASVEIQMAVTQPIYTRPYVNYKRAFLDDYEPNITQYLPESVCQRLFNMGKTDGERPAGTYARQIFHRLLIDLSWNSSRLEGNTYSLLETERLLELSEIAEGKDFKEAQMILNHKAAIEFLLESQETLGINRYTILNLHTLLANNLLTNEKAYGQLRKIPVGIEGTVYLPTAIPQLIEECFQQILTKASAIINPFEQAFFLMVHLPYLQPFEDVNKRTSRLAANIPFIIHNMCPLSFVDVSQQMYVNGLLGVYELNRIDLLRDIFAWAYERSCLLYSTTRATLGEPDPFRIRYRREIFETVTSVVQNRLNKKMAIRAIQQKAEHLVPSEDRSQFIEAVETSLRGLHEGNIARFRLRPVEYEAWHKNWH